jgi:hypothetical protein
MPYAMRAMRMKRMRMMRKMTTLRFMVGGVDLGLICKADGSIFILWCGEVETDEATRKVSKLHKLWILASSTYLVQFS